MKSVMLVFGTRPEAIKMAPLVKLFKNNLEVFNTYVCVTGQHREMLDQVLEIFEIKPDFDLNIMQSGQDLYDVTVNVLLGMRDVFTKITPDYVFVHGDTTTSTAAALAAFYKQIPVGHIEAGLRTNEIYSPWPEEMNRQITGRLASFHFAPTLSSKNNLLKENIDENKIIITGNTVIDALKYVVNEIESNESLKNKIQKKIIAKGYNAQRLVNDKKMILITGHRRENFGIGFLNICNAILQLTIKYPEVDFIYPMHLNPNVRNSIKTVFGNIKAPNIFFIEPLDYLSFVYIMERSYIILTDSGGVQEEAPSLGKPVLVMRDTTERPEAVEAGTVKLVGTDLKKIIIETSNLLDNRLEYDLMSNSVNPYGDGKACKRILNKVIELI